MTTRSSRKQIRKSKVPLRLERLVNLRKLGAPKWIIKSEQIALYMNSKGMRSNMLDPSKKQLELQERHVVPLLGD